MGIGNRNKIAKDANYAKEAGQLTTIQRHKEGREGALVGTNLLLPRWFMGSRVSLLSTK